MSQFFNDHEIQNPGSYLRDKSHSLLDNNREKFAYHFCINYDLNLETAEFLALGLWDFGETLFNARH